MFKINDLWEILEYIYYTNTGDRIRNDINLNLLDNNIKAISLSEYSKSLRLFENTIDQIPFTSSDYKRLRSFLISLYASHRTLSKLQNDSLDLFSITNKNLDELFKSFGFHYSYFITDFETKVNFFLDLVNLYKIKGTPEALMRALAYYKSKNTDLVEYLLKLDSKDNLVFEPVTVGEKSRQYRNIPFDILTKSDPHWFQNKSQIHDLISKNDITLPSKTPYIGLSTPYRITSLNKHLAYFHRIINDKTQDYLNNGNIEERNIFIIELEQFVNITELYLSIIYCFNNVSGYSKSDSDDRYIINNTDKNDNFDDFEDIYDNLFEFEYNREYVSNRISEYKNKVTRPIDDFYLNGKDASIGLLEEMNPDLGERLKIEKQSGGLSDLIPFLVEQLDVWVSNNITYYFPNIGIYLFGLKGLLYLDVINFFKPYRSRLVNFDTFLHYDNRLFNSVILEDKTKYDLDLGYFVLHGKADIDTNCQIDHQEMIFDCGYLFDAGIVDDYALTGLNLHSYQNNIYTSDEFRNFEIEQELKTNINIKEDNSYKLDLGLFESIFFDDGYYFDGGIVDDEVFSYIVEQLTNFYLNISSNISILDIEQHLLSFGKPDPSNDCQIDHQEMVFDCGYLFDAGIVDDNLNFDMEDSLKEDYVYNRTCQNNIDIYSTESIDETIKTISVTNNFIYFDTDEFVFDERGKCYQEELHINVYES